MEIREHKQVVLVVAKSEIAIHEDTRRATETEREEFGKTGFDHKNSSKLTADC